MQLPDYPILGKAIDKYIENPALAEFVCGPPAGISYITRFFRLKYNPIKQLYKEKPTQPKPTFAETWANKTIKVYRKEAQIGKIEQEAPVRPAQPPQKYSDLLLSYQYWPIPEMEDLPVETQLSKKKHDSFAEGLPVQDEPSVKELADLDDSRGKFELSTNSLPELLLPPLVPAPIEIPEIAVQEPPAVIVPMVYSSRINIPEESAEDLEEVAPLEELPRIAENRRVSIRYSITSLGKGDETLTRDGPGSDSLPAVSPKKQSLWRSSLKEEGLQETTPERRIERPRLRVSFGSNILQEKDYLTSKRQIKMPPRGRVSAHHVFGSHHLTGRCQTVPKDSNFVSGTAKFGFADFSLPENVWRLIKRYYDG